MENLKKLTDEVFNKIVHYNSKTNLEAIPHSDLFEKEIQSLLGIEKGDIKQILNLLKEGHRIFTFEITKEDKDKEVKRIEGYVESDLQTIRKLKNYFQSVLMDEYEKQFNAKLLVNQIIKEVYTRPNYFKNTPIGQIANKAIMLAEYENLIEKEFHNYTDSFKQERMNELYRTAEVEISHKIEGQKDDTPAGRDSSSLRAIDSEMYNDFSNAKSTQSLDKVLQIYGVEFFYRVNLRKYNFDLLTQIIENGKINRRNDLKILKNMLQKVKNNFDIDPKLNDYKDKIYKLERALSRFIFFSN